MTNKLTGRCLNIGNCTAANGMKIIDVNSNEEFVCPECGKSLHHSSEGSIGDTKKYRPLAVGGLIVAGVILAIFGVSRLQIGDKSTGSAAKPSSNIPSGEKPMLRLVGSNTIGAALGPDLVKGFFEEKGCLKVDIKEVKHDFFDISCKLDGQNIYATVESKGSSTSFRALKAGTADVGMSSRRIKPEEVADLSSLGDLSSSGSEHIIALDGLAVVTHPSNSIRRLNIKQLKSLFEGQTVDFSDVGGINSAVSVYRRDDNSGTYDTFKSIVMGKSKISSNAKTYEDSRKLSQDVSNDPGSIGFVGFTHIGSSKAVPIGEDGQQALLPTRFTIATEDYPLARRLYLYTLSSSSNPEVGQFIKYVLSEKGQKIVEANDFVPMSIVKQQSSSSVKGSSLYQKLTHDAERLSTNFRFNTGSDKLDNRALADLDRVTEFLIRTSTPPSKLLLIGFADSTGNPQANITLSKQRAQTVAAALRSRGITPRVITGFGSENPVASNLTPEGQEKNRRVEVWVSK